MLKAFSGLGLTGTEPMDARGSTISPRDVALALYAMAPMPDDLPPPVSSFLVCVRGKQGDDSVHVVYTCCGKMTLWTGIPASIGTLMLCMGEIQTKGVLAPEGCVDTNRFLAEIAMRGMEVEEAEERVRILK